MTNNNTKWNDEVESTLKPLQTISDNLSQQESKKFLEGGDYDSPHKDTLSKPYSELISAAGKSSEISKPVASSCKNKGENDSFIEEKSSLVTDIECESANKQMQDSIKKGTFGPYNNSMGGYGFKQRRLSEELEECGDYYCNYKNIKIADLELLLVQNIQDIREML